MQVGYEDTEESVDPVIKKKLIVEDTEVIEVGGIEVGSCQRKVHNCDREEESSQEKI